MEDNNVVFEMQPGKEARGGGVRGRGDRGGLAAKRDQQL